MVEKRDEFPQVTAKHNGRSKKMTSSRRIEKQNADRKQRFGELIQVDHDLIPVKQKAMKQGPLNDSTNDVVQALVVTRFSRLQVLKGLAALSAVAMFPSFLTRNVLAQTVGGTTTGTAAWSAGWKERFKDRAILVREAMVLAQINQIYRMNPNADPRKVAAEMVRFRQGYNRMVLEGCNELCATAKNYHHMIKTSLELVQSLEIGVSLGAEVSWNPATFMKGVYEGVVELPWLQNRFADMTAVWANRQQVEKWFQYGNKIPGILAETTTPGNSLRDEAVFQTYIDTDLPHLKDLQAAIQTGNTAPVVQAVNTILNTMQPPPKPETKEKILNACKSSGPFPLTIEEVRKILEDELAPLGLKAQEDLEAAEPLDEQQQNILKYTPAEQALIRQMELAAVRQKILDSASTLVNILSTLVGAANPKLGHQISVIGSSTIQVVDAIGGFCDAIAAFNADKLTGLALGMSGAMATGNIVGAVMNVVGLFANNSSPEQMIMEQIGALQKQVSQMQTQMHERFDRIELMLTDTLNGISSIFEMCADAFTAMLDGSGQIYAKVDQLQQQLLKQEMVLSRLGESLHKGLEEVLHADLYKDITLGLGYKERHPDHADMPYDIFDECQNTIYTYAVVEGIAKGEVEQPVTDVGYEDGDLLKALRGTGNLYKPLEKRVMYLSNWMRLKTPLDEFTKETGRLCNMVTWSYCANAYTQLRIENPKFAAAGGFPARAVEIEREGENLLKALRRISVKEDTPEGPAPNHELFAFLIQENYKTKVAVLDTDLQNVASNSLSEWKTLTLKRDAKEPNVDPWGGALQKIDGHRPASFPPYTPEALLALLPAPYMLADYMKLDAPALSISILPRWTGLTTSKSTFPDGIGWETKKTAILEVTVTVNYGSTIIFTRSVKSDRMVIYYTWYYPGDHGDPEARITPEITPQEAFDDNWDAGQLLRQRFETSLSQMPPTFSDDLLNPVVTKVEAELGERRKAIYDRAHRELSDGVSELYKARLNLDGAQVLIDAFVHLGMPIALESDDFIRALLYGQQSLVNGSQIETRYSEAVAAQPEQDPRLQLRQDADARADALGNSLKAWLDLIGEEKHIETQRAIETTLAKSGTVSIAARALSQAVATPPTVPTPPKVSSVTPANNATGVKRNTNITATFSEKMDPSTLTKSTFKLFKVNTDGSTTQITNVTVTPSTDGLKATLNPFGTSTTLLAKSTRYKAIVTTGAKNVAGKPLDQNSTTTGNQQMVWSFKTGLL